MVVFVTWCGGVLLVCAWCDVCLVSVTWSSVGLKQSVVKEGFGVLCDRLCEISLPKGPIVLPYVPICVRECAILWQPLHMHVSNVCVLWAVLCGVCVLFIVPW